VERVLKKIPITQVKNVSRMLVGVADEDASDTKFFTPETRQIDSITVLEDGRLSLSLKKLLSSRDPDVDLYGDGAELLEKRLVGEAGLLQGTPLESAYAWALACRAAVEKELRFFKRDSGKFRVKGTDLQAGTLFKANDEDNFDLTSLQPDVIYYVNEIPGNKNTPGTPTQPIADIFFRTTDGHVVLIDVSGSNGTDVKKGNRGDRVATKEEKLVKTTLKMQTKMEGNEMAGHKGLKVHGVVLAPFDERPSTEQQSSKGNRVMVVRGDDALRLLGGLRQLSRWVQ